MEDGLKCSWCGKEVGEQDMSSFKCGKTMKEEKMCGKRVHWKCIQMRSGSYNYNCRQCFQNNFPEEQVVFPYTNG